MPTHDDVPRSNPLHRRRFLVGSGAAAAALALPALAQSRGLRLASTFDNSGVEKANGSGCFTGATACERIDGLDLGGVRIGYGSGNRIGGTFVDVAVIGSGGRIMS